MLKIGIYIDSENIRRNGGFSMRYDVLAEYSALSGIPVRQNTYHAFNDFRAEEDEEYEAKLRGYFAKIRSFGYKVIIKPVKVFFDDEGNRFTKSNSDLDMATDILIQAKNLDKIVLLTGDGDFKKVVRAVQNMGVRVEVLAFNNFSRDLIFECDRFTSGYIIPNLLPIEGKDAEDWGEVGHKCRGQVYAVNQGFGFLRIMDKEFDFQEVFFPFAALPEGHYVRLDNIYEFTITEGERGALAADMKWINVGGSQN